MLRRECDRYGAYMVKDLSIWLKMIYFSLFLISSGVEIAILTVWFGEKIWSQIARVQNCRRSIRDSTIGDTALLAVWSSSPAPSSSDWPESSHTPHPQHGIALVMAPNYGKKRRRVRAIWLPTRRTWFRFNSVSLYLFFDHTRHIISASFTQIFNIHINLCMCCLSEFFVSMITLFL